jgi:hypothetical protein
MRAAVNGWTTSKTPTERTAESLWSVGRGNGCCRVLVSEAFNIQWW